MPFLNVSQIDLFQKNGYLILMDFTSKEECQELLNQAKVWVEKLKPEWQKAVFSSRDQTKTSDDYFLASGDKIRIFMEEEKDEDGTPRVNKLGHALHELDPVFKTFSERKTAEIAQDLGISRPLPIQSMYIFKSPKIGGEVHIHQDSTFLYTEPLSVIGFWHALEDATMENGCLWALPGGHTLGLKTRFVRDDETGVRFDTLDSTPLPEKGYIPLEVPAGSLVILHGLLPHYSDVNRSAHSREAYALHVIDETAKYPEENWLQKSPVHSPFAGKST